jgi:hypothetical protein
MLHLRKTHQTRWLGWLELFRVHTIGSIQSTRNVQCTLDCTSDNVVFNLVCAYMIKDVNKCKKARCTCNGLPCSGQVWILDYTYANCVDQTSTRIFYEVLAAENLIIFGADVSNTFAEAPPPKQGFYIHPDKVFCNWWVNHKKCNPIPPGAVILALLAMQGHPKSPKLWGKHADCILCKVGLFPTTHEPCLYLGIINGQRVLFLWQVDDFAIACSDESTANCFFDMLDKKLMIPLKQISLLNLYNGLNVIQTWDFIKINCSVGRRGTNWAQSSPDLDWYLEILAETHHWRSRPWLP